MISFDYSLAASGLLRDGDQDVAAWEAAVVAAGGTLTPSQKLAVYNTVVALKAASKWSGMLGFYPLMGGNAASCALNARNLSKNITWSGTPNISDKGVMFDGAWSYGDTGINPNMALTGNVGTIGFGCNLGFTRPQNGGRHDAEIPMATMLQSGHSDSNGWELTLGLSQDNSVARLQSFTGGSANGGNFNTSALTEGRVFGITTGLSSRRIFKNGTQVVADTSTSSGTGPNRTIYVGARNLKNDSDNPTVDSYCNKNYSFFMISADGNYSDAATFETIFSAFETTAGRDNTCFIDDINLAFIGDSLTRGNGADGTTNYPDYVKAYTTRLTVRNSGVAGITAATLAANSTEETAFYTTRMADNIAIVWAGTNDIATSTSGTIVSTTLANLNTLCTNLQSARFKVIVCNIIGRGGNFGGGVNQASFDTNRAAFNSALGAGYGSFADAYVDLDAISQLQNYNNGTYFNGDKTHLTAAGYQIVANAVIAQLQFFFNSGYLAIGDFGNGDTFDFLYTTSTGYLAVMNAGSITVWNQNTQQSQDWQGNLVGAVSLDIGLNGNSILFWPSDSLGGYVPGGLIEEFDCDVDSVSAFGSQPNPYRVNLNQCEGIQYSVIYGNPNISIYSIQGTRNSLLYSDSSYTNHGALDFTGFAAIDTINVDGNASLGTIKAKNCTTLTAFFADSCSLDQTTLDISGSTNITSLSLGSNAFTSVDSIIANLAGLIALSVSGNTLGSIDLTHNPLLEDFEAGICGLTGAFDLSICPLLQFITLNTNPFTSINCSGLSQLTYFNNTHCTSCTSANFSNCTAPTLAIYIDHNALTALPTLTGTTGPNRLQVNNNSISGNLNISALTNTQYFICSFNAGITGFTFGSNLVHMTQLTTDNCGITGAFDVRALTLLQSFSIHHNSGLTSINCTNMVNLLIVNCYSCAALATLSVTGCTAMNQISAYDTILSTLTAPSTITLSYLDIHNSQGTGVCTSLTLTGCTGLSQLLCYSLKLTSLNLTGLTALSYVNAIGMSMLTSLTISGNPALHNLYLTNDGFTAVSLNAIYTLLPTWTSGNKGQLQVTGNPGDGTDTKTIATLKNWQFI